MGHFLFYRTRKMKLLGLLPAFALATCPELTDEDIVWAGAQVTKTKPRGNSVHKIMVNMNKLKATADNEDRGKARDYTGFIGWSKRKCGKPFLDALADGTVGVHMMDKYFSGEDYPYQDSGFRHHQLTVEKGYPAAWIQFTHDGESEKTLGNQYKDQFHLLFTGLDNVDFGAKDMEACLTGGMVGHSSVDGACDYTKWLGENKILWS